MKRVLQKAAFIAGYFYTGVACAVGVMLCTAFALIPVADAVKERWTRRMICRLSAGLVGYLRLFGLLHADFGTLGELGKRRGVIIAVNHPTYIDAILIMSQLPDVFCLTKASILRNPWVAAMARCAGYESNAESRRLVENCAVRLRRGENLLIFPEGTRTTVPLIGPLKRGFALMAVCAAAPVITVTVIFGNGPFLRKGQPFFDFPPSLPLRYRFSVTGEFVPAPQESTRQFGAKIRNHFCTILSATPSL